MREEGEAVRWKAVSTMPVFYGSKVRNWETGARPGLQQAWTTPSVSGRLTRAVANG